jgi:ATP-dependent protease ClpP protease subunit
MTDSTAMPFATQPLLHRGVVFTRGVINDDTLPEVISALLEAREKVGETARIKYFISSSGGYAEVALALFDFIKGMGLVDTYAFGAVESAATILFAAGDRRFVFPHSILGFHQVHVGGEGFSSAGHARLADARLDHIDKQYASILADTSNKDKNWWLQTHAKGVQRESYFLTAQQLVDLEVAQYATAQDFVFARPTNAAASTQHVPAPSVEPIAQGPTDRQPPTPTTNQ